MHLHFAFVCDHAATTPEGKLDAHGIYHDRAAPGFPARQERMVFVAVLEWDREDSGRHKFRVDLADPTGKPVLTIDGHTDVDPRPAGRPRARTELVLPLEDVIFPVAGRYAFEIRAKGRRLRGPTLDVVEAPAEGDAPAASEAPALGGTATERKAPARGAGREPGKEPDDASGQAPDDASASGAADAGDAAGAAGGPAAG